MKKKMKLTLSRETLSSLEDAKLQRIAGGCTDGYTDCPCEPDGIALRAINRC